MEVVSSGNLLWRDLATIWDCIIIIVAKLCQPLFYEGRENHGKIDELDVLYACKYRYKVILSVTVKLEPNSMRSSSSYQRLNFGARSVVVVQYLPSLYFDASTKIHQHLTHWVQWVSGSIRNTKLEISIDLCHFNGTP